MGIGGYWGRVHKRAYQNARHALSLESTGSVVIAGFVAAIYLLLVWHFVGADEAHVELTDRFLGWLTPFLLFPLVYIWKIIAAPSEIDAEARTKLLKLQPRLRLSFTKQQGVVHLGIGSVSETVTGKRYTAELASEIVLRVICTNESALRTENCRAFLINVRAVANDGALVDIGFLEPVPLSWSRDLSQREYATTLEPNMPKAIYLLTRRQHPALLLYRVSKELPFEYGRMFKDHSKYRLSIQVNGQDDAADTMCLDVWPTESNSPGSWGIGVEIVSTGAAAPIY